MTGPAQVVRGAGGRPAPVQRQRQRHVTPVSAGFAAAGTVLVAVAILVLRVRDEHADFPWWLFLVNALGVGALYGVAGQVAWHRRPDSPVGPLMVATALLWLAADLALSGSRLLFTLGLLAFQAFTAPLVHLTLAFPTGLRRRRLDRVLVVAGYTAVGAHSALNATLAPADNRGVRSYLQLDGGSQNPPWYFSFPGLVLLLVQVTVLGLVVVRWRRASPPARRSTGLVVVAAALSTADFVLTNVVGDPQGPVWAALLGLALGAVPLAFLLALLTGQLRRGRVERLVTGLREGTADELRDAVAVGLGDPDAQVLHLVDGRHVDADGRQVVLPEPADPLRAVTLLRRRSEVVGAIVHDRAVLDEPRRLEAVAAATGLAVENARLAAEVLVQLADVQASRARLVAAGDSARRRMERDLHDGAQQRLVSLSLVLRLARRQVPDGPDGPDALAQTLDEASAELAAALAELRELARGLAPPVLAEHGLAAALDALAGRAGLPVELGAVPAQRLPASVETAAYYVVAEAVTNAAKHAAAGVVDICAALEQGVLRLEVRDDGSGGADRDGSGLRGLADRVEALGGSLSVHSPPGGGTRLLALIPCHR